MEFQDSLMCPVCFGQYDAEEHFPRILPCGNGHSACSWCITQLLSSSGSSLKCPFDRQTIPLSGKNLSDFPQNLALRNFIRDHDPATFCQMHGDKKLDIVCLECKCRICYICERRQHRGHPTELLEDIPARVSEIKKKFQECIIEIDEPQTKRKTIIEKRESKLLEAVDNKFQEEMNKLMEQRDAIKQKIRETISKFKEETCAREETGNSEASGWVNTIKWRLTNREFTITPNNQPENELFFLIDQEASLKDEIVEKRLKAEKEKTELLLCALDDISVNCNEIIEKWSLS